MPIYGFWCRFRSLCPLFFLDSPPTMTVYMYQWRSITRKLIEINRQSRVIDTNGIKVSLSFRISMAENTDMLNVTFVLKITKSQLFILISISLPESLMISFHHHLYTCTIVLHFLTPLQRGLAAPL